MGERSQDLLKELIAHTFKYNKHYFLHFLTSFLLWFHEMISNYSLHFAGKVLAKNKSVGCRQLCLSPCLCARLFVNLSVRLFLENLLKLKLFQRIIYWRDTQSCGVQCASISWFFLQVPSMMMLGAGEQYRRRESWMLCSSPSMQISSVENRHPHTQAIIYHLPDLH